ncbi:MAG TPA: LLM class flavin-dependent oxidoreductase [Stellaceae bacterium]|nr:LLM class flavin-dependent oxidoreductase [Stellaceae bacterium]
MKTKSGVSLGISLPYSFPDARVDHAYIRRFVRRAEALGFDDGWLTEGILNPNFVLEPVTYIAHLAALTETIRFGISVIILNYRNPIQLAKQLATVDHLSNGRLTVGFGLGGGTSLYPAFGIDEKKRVSRFEEAFKVMNALWTQERVTLDGQFWKLSNQGMQPRPLQKPRIPVFLGGHSEPAMRRAIRLAGGWMAAGSTGSEESLDDLARMHGYLAEAGVDPKSFWLSKRIYIAVEDDEAKARQKLNAALSYQYAGRDQSHVGLAATPSQAVAWLKRFIDAGVNHILLNPCYEHESQMETLATKVVPQL